MPSNLTQLFVYGVTAPVPGEVALRFGRNLETDPEVILITDEKSIKIEHIRQLQVSLSSSPQSPQGRLVIICPGERLTTAAQQALLKLLEEPPDNTQLVLTVDAPQSLLPTILSRCLCIYVQPEKGSQLDNSDSLYSRLLACDSEQARVELIQSLPSAREDVSALLLTELAQPLEPTTQGVEWKRKLLEVSQALKANVSPALCWERLLL
jgi:hypothetical protein